MALTTHLETILVIETSVDDTSPQIVGYVLEQALEQGALDAYATPLQMKKNRPGVLLTILARPEQRQALVELLLRETSTLGVRVGECQREVLERSLETVTTAYGVIRVKRAPAGAGAKAAPEYEDCRAAARRHGVPLRQVLEAALAGVSQPEQRQ
ncbi:MAG TPA: nickel insertion protein [Terriglobales bacterium]|nr:nickel insertion protein [Terriglobales bacterium]